MKRLCCRSPAALSNTSPPLTRRAPHNGPTSILGPEAETSILAGSRLTLETHSLVDLTGHSLDTPAPELWRNADVYCGSFCVGSHHNLRLRNAQPRGYATHRDSKPRFLPSAAPTLDPTILAHSLDLSERHWKRKNRTFLQLVSSRCAL